MAANNRSHTPLLDHREKRTNTLFALPKRLADRAMAIRFAQAREPLRRRDGCQFRSDLDLRPSLVSAEPSGPIDRPEKTGEPPTFNAPIRKGA